MFPLATGLLGSCPPSFLLAYTICTVANGDRSLCTGVNFCWRFPYVYFLLLLSLKRVEIIVQIIPNLNSYQIVLHHITLVNLSLKRERNPRDVWAVPEKCWKIREVNKLIRRGWQLLSDKCVEHHLQKGKTCCFQGMNGQFVSCWKTVCREAKRLVQSVLLLAKLLRKSTLFSRNRRRKLSTAEKLWEWSALSGSVQLKNSHV